MGKEMIIKALEEILNTCETKRESGFLFERDMETIKTELKKLKGEN